MHLATLFLLPLSLLVLSRPLIVEHEIIQGHPFQNHVDPLHPIHPRCIMINTPRSLPEEEKMAMKITPHTTRPHKPSNSNPPTLLSRALQIFNLFRPSQHTTSPHSPSELQTQPKLLTRTLSRRDSVSITISNTLNHTTICNSQNSAKFNVVNNAKNAEITVDSANTTSQFRTFGNKNMLNSTGSNTDPNQSSKQKEKDEEEEKDMGEEEGRDGEMRKRDWNWKQWFDEVLMGGDYGRWDMPWRAPAPGSSKEGRPKWGSKPSEKPKTTATVTTSVDVASETQSFTAISTPPIVPGPWDNKTEPHHGGNHSHHGWGNHTKNETGQWGEEHKRDIVDLNILSGSSNSSVTASGNNNNTVELYVAGNGDNVVNITVVWEGEDSNMENLGNGNIVRVYVGDSKGVDMGNSTLKVIGGEGEL